MRLTRWAVVELVALVAAWQLAASMLQVSFLPPPFEVMHSLIVEMPRGLAYHLAISSLRVALGNTVAVILAVPLAYVTTQSSYMDKLFTAFAMFMFPIPKVVFLPLILLLFGMGDISKVVLLVLVISFQMFVIVRDAVHSVSPETLNSIRSLGANRWHLLRHVYVPATIPAVLTALKIGTGTAIAVLFIAESFATRTGLGYYIMVETWGRMAYAQMFAGIIAMGLLGLGFYGVLEVLEKRLCRWMDQGNVGQRAGSTTTFD